MTVIDLLASTCEIADATGACFVVIDVDWTGSSVALCRAFDSLEDDAYDLLEARKAFALRFADADAASDAFNAIASGIAHNPRAKITGTVTLVGVKVDTAGGDALRTVTYEAGSGRIPSVYFGRVVEMGVGIEL